VGTREEFVCLGFIRREGGHYGHQALVCLCAHTHTHTLTHTHTHTHTHIHEDAVAHKVLETMSGQTFSQEILVTLHPVLIKRYKDIYKRKSIQNSCIATDIIATNYL